MKSVIEEIYYEGAVNEKNNLSELYHILHKQKLCAVEAFKKGLSTEQKEQLQKLYDLEEMIEREIIFKCYKDGFHAGVHTVLNMFGLKNEVE